MRHPMTCITRLTGLCLLAWLSACGGGTTSAPPAMVVTVPSGAPFAAPVLTLTPLASKTFRFSWIDVEGETEYRLLEDIDGTSGYERLEGMAPDTTQFDASVFLPARINARYILQACQGSTCVDSAPVSVTGNLAQAIGYLKAATPAEGAGFGQVLALSGDGKTLAVSAPGDDSTSAGEATDSGAVYVFTREEDRWQQHAYVKASVVEEFARFGTSLALSNNGNVLAVGAPGEANGGAAYVFVRSAGTWTQQQRLQASNAGSGSRFGSSLALSAAGDALVVGDPDEDTMADNSGAAYVFTRDGLAWSETALLKSGTAFQNESFGSALALAGRLDQGFTLAVGAPGVSFGSGLVHVFTGQATSWDQPPTVLQAPYATVDMLFGDRVALSSNGQTLAVGAPGDGSAATDVGGNAQNADAAWSGAVHVFTRDGTAWSHQAYIKASNTDPNDNFGRALALSGSGDTLVVGAPNEESSGDGLNGEQSRNDSSEVGAAYVFTREAGTWSRQAYVKASNSGGGDTFGRGIGLSADGRTLAVGADGEDSSGSGWNGEQNNNGPLDSGAVYLY